MADDGRDLMRDRRRLGSLALNPQLDRWVAFRPDGTVVIRTGKAELGQGIRTALALIAADELGVDAECIAVEGPKSGRSPNEGVTAGSGSIEQSGTAVRQACAHARQLLVQRAAVALDVDAGDIRVESGWAVAPSGRKASFWELTQGRPFDFDVTAPADPVPVDTHVWVGRGMPRLDLAAKIRGEPVFVHDLELPAMLHARVIRPPRRGATLLGLRDVVLERARLVVKGSYLAVVAEREADAIAAADATRQAAEWADGEAVPTGADAPDYLEAHAEAATLIADGTAVVDPPPPPFDLARSPGLRVVEARYSKPFVMHGSIGPSAAAAKFEDGRLHLWSHSQGVELLRLSVAEALGLDPDVVSAEHVDGAGCYGHNGADDVALDAAIAAVENPGRPVLLKWTRADEHGWEPLSPAMSMRLAGALDADGCITAWQHDVYSYSHGARPRPTGADRSGLLAAWSFEPPRRRPRPQPSRGFHSGTHRNADPLYDVGDKRVVAHSVPGNPLRTSSTRGLGAFGNVFAIESFMDELAAAADADPIEFRLAHLRDGRARAVLEAVADLAGGLTAPGGIDAPGRGIAFARYENIKTYVAVIAEVVVVPHTGAIKFTRAWIAADAGQVIDPDGLVNQLEGGLVQAASWTLKEQVEFDGGGVTSLDWESYPILRFSEAPEVHTRLIDQPHERSLGAGEATTGPTPAAIANAVFQATGARIRDLPMRPQRVKAALAALV